MKIIKVPSINGLGMTNGCERGPDAISQDGEKIQLDLNDVDEQEKSIYNFVKKLKSKSIFIGGDHSISYPITKAIYEKYPGLKLIVLDAHPDLMPPMQNPTHEEWLKAVLDLGIKPQNVVIIGARNIDLKEIGHKVKMIPIKDIKSSLEEIKNFTNKTPLYLSIDIDFFDKSIAQATGYPENNGASKKEGLDLIKFILENSKIVGTDIVEINPTKKGANETVSLAKEILETLKNGLK